MVEPDHHRDVLAWILRVKNLESKRSTAFCAIMVRLVRAIWNSSFEFLVRILVAHTLLMCKICVAWPSTVLIQALVVSTARCTKWLANRKRTLLLWTGSVLVSPRSSSLTIWRTTSPMRASETQLPLQNFFLPLTSSPHVAGLLWILVLLCPNPFRFLLKPAGRMKLRRRTPTSFIMWVLLTLCLRTQ